MEFRLTNIGDFEVLKDMYKQIVKNMNDNTIPIWDDIKYSNKGIGAFMVEKAKKIAKSIGFDYLRLFVVDINISAIKLCEKKYL